MRDFVAIEMLHHSKALELLANSYQHLSTINEEEDLEVSASGFDDTRGSEIKQK